MNRKDIYIGSEVWREAWGPKRIIPILETNHGKVLEQLVTGLAHLWVIDLGCGKCGAKDIFPDYNGIDLPEWDVYKDSCLFIAEYDIVLMNAFIDALEKPMIVLNLILSNATNYVVLHRQEFTDEKTHCTKELAYGGWTWHSKINREEFEKLLVHRKFKIIKELSCGFDNWKDGGSSILMQKI